ncbi:MAG: hypothetical protein LV473_17545 [Nitrospira sp.]|nr:hypothetical protein [Nitrospira sp.]
MNTKSMWVIGLMAMMATIGVGNAPGFAADQNRGDNLDPRIGHGGSTYFSSQPDGAGDCQVTGAERRKVDVIERIGTGGSTYSFSQSPSAQASACQMAGRKVDVEQRIGHGGSTYSYSQSTVQAVSR